MKMVDKIYLYDNSFEGLLSVIYKCICLKEIPLKIHSELDYVDTLIDQPIFIEKVTKNANILWNKIKSISSFSLYLINTAFFSGNVDKDLIIYKYILNCLKYESKITYLRNNNSVIQIMDITKKVKREAHRLKGFLRFKELNENILYAVIEPDNNVLEYLVRHFIKRLSQEKWIIHDKKRNLVAVYDSKKIYYGVSDDLDLDKIEKISNEDAYEKYWKNYFQRISIKERKNRRCQLNFMPKKYWKNMLEIEEER